MEQIGNRGASIADRVRDIVAAAGNSVPPVNVPTAPVAPVPATSPAPGLQRLDAVAVLTNITTAGIQLAVSGTIFYTEFLN